LPKIEPAWCRSRRPGRRFERSLVAHERRRLVGLVKELPDAVERGARRYAITANPLYVRKTRSVASVVKLSNAPPTARLWMCWWAEENRGATPRDDPNAWASGANCD